MVGLALWAAPVRDWLRAAGCPRPVAEAGGVTIAATLATAPLLAVHFGQVSLVSLPANLVVAPFVAPMMWLGMLAGAAAQLSPALATPFNLLAAPLIGFMDAAADVAAGVPHAVLAVQLPGLLGAAAGYASRGRVARGARAAPRSARARASRAGRRSQPSLVAGWFAGPAAPRRRVRGRPSWRSWTSGQGDATLVQREGASRPVRHRSAGGAVIARLEEVGLEAPRRARAHPRPGRPRGRGAGGGRALPAAGDRRRRRGLAHARAAGAPAAAARTGARLLRVAAGDAIRLGPLELDVLSPAGGRGLPPTGDPNNRALVTHLRSGAFDLLLTADAESDVTAGLELPRVEALKVAHHGSDDPGLPAELEQLRPDVAVIEVGRHNTYGHPTAATLQALRVVPHVYRTDQGATVELRVRERTGHRRPCRLGAPRRDSRRGSTNLDR